VQQQNMYHVSTNPFISQPTQMITKTQVPICNSYCNCSN